MKEVMSGASVAFIMKAASAGLQFCLNVFLARLLGAQGAGMYFLALTITTVATVGGRLGLDNTLLRYTAANSSIENWSAVKGAYVKSMALAVPASIFAALIVLLLSPFLAAKLFGKPDLTIVLRWMALSVVPMTLYLLHAQALKGLKQISKALLVQGVGPPALAIVGICVLAKRWGVCGAAWSHTIASALTALLGIIFWRAATPQLTAIKANFSTSELLSSSLPLFWVTSMQMVITWTASISLGIWGTTAEVGIYNVAARTAMLTNVILIAVNTIVAPKFAALYLKGDMEALGSIARNSAKLMTVIAIPVLLLFFSAPGWVMGIFGSQFSDWGVVLAIISFAQFINVATGSVSFLLMMCGFERLMRNNIVFCAGLNVLLNVTLVPWLGVIGAALSAALTIAMMNIVSAILVWHALRIRTIPFLTARLLSPLFIIRQWMRH